MSRHNEIYRGDEIIGYGEPTQTFKHCPECDNFYLNGYEWTRSELPPYYEVELETCDTCREYMEIEGEC